MVSLLDLYGITVPPKAQKPVKVAVRQQGKLNADRLVILRMGLGRDSMTMLVLLAQGELVIAGKKRGPSEVDAVIFTDPGHEWPFTYALIPRVKAFCDRYGIRFLVQKKPPAEGPKGWVAWKLHQVARREAARRRGLQKALFGSPPWRIDPPASIEAKCDSGYYHERIPLFEDYGSKDAWIAKGDSSCTINHKIKPGRELVADLMVERFGKLPIGGSAKRLGYTQQGAAWADLVKRGERRPHLMLIGYAADEEKRLKEVKQKKDDWSFGFDTEAYPLMEMGISKTGEQQVLNSHMGVDADGRFVVGGFADVKKSGCRSCIHQDPAQWWMLRTLDPEYFQQIVEHEQRVIARRGPWQAIFPQSFVAVIKRTGQINPEIAKMRREGWTVTLAQRVSSERGAGTEWRAMKDADLDVEEELDLDDSDRARAFVWIPLSAKVDAWLAEYVRMNGRQPDPEEVAAKEYRGCAVEFKKKGSLARWFSGESRMPKRAPCSACGSVAG